MDLKTFDRHGNVINPSFECHMGKRILSNLKIFGDKLNQIEILSGAKETSKSFRTRTIQAAEGLKRRGLKVGDIVMICANNHNDASVPFVASLYQGYLPVNLATGMTKSEINHVLNLAPPKVIFSDPEKAFTIETIMKELELNVEIIVFSSDSKYLNFSDFLQPITNEDDFECEDFDPSTTTAFAACSSGSTGLPKLVAITHKTITLQKILPLVYMHNENDTYMDEASRYLNFSPMFWISGIISVIGSCVYGFTRIQCRQNFTPEIAKYAIETYKPDQAFLPPSIIYELLKYPHVDKIDFSSINIVYSGGNILHPEAVQNFRGLLPNGNVSVCYGGTEVLIITSCSNFGLGSIGKMPSWVDWKIVDVDTEEKLGPNTPGELRLKTPTTFQCYYGNPESTVKAFDSNGYYKTGDLIKYDENGNFYFVDRCSEVIKYGNYQIASGELEAIIRSLPEIQNVAVVGLQHSTYGQIPMAFVQLVPGVNITAQQIKDIIKNSLSDYKQLRGGVVFLDKIPMTHSGKINRKELNLMKLTIKAE